MICWILLYFCFTSILIVFLLYNLHIRSCASGLWPLSSLHHRMLLLKNRSQRLYYTCNNEHVQEEKWWNRTEGKRESKSSWMNSRVAFRDVIVYSRRRKPVGTTRGYAAVNEVFEAPSYGSRCSQQDSYHRSPFLNKLLVSRRTNDLK